ncbi:MAG: hypothetical protein ACPMAQ_04290 [Phycisphaerae bacterium]
MQGRERTRQAVVKMLERFWLGCAGCQGREGCHLIPSPEPHEATSAEANEPVAIPAVLVFLLPSGLAIATAALASHLTSPVSNATGPYELAGLLVGFAAGVAAARLLVAGWRHVRRTAGKRREENP